MANPYAPPQAVVRDIADPSALTAPAGRGIRLGATTLDSIIFAAMVYAPVLLASAGGGAMAAAGSEGSSNVMLAAGSGLAVVGFTVWCWLTITYVSRNGQSIGKKLLGIKVVRSDGSPVSLGRLFWLRNVVNGLFSLIPLYGFADAISIFGESRQCLHDRIAGTIVLRA